MAVLTPRSAVDDQVISTQPPPEEMRKRSESGDGDDQVVYTWSLPEEKTKAKRSETGDGDDQVVYTWSLPSED